MRSKARLCEVSTCTTASYELAEPLFATAATATTWLLLEQPGPWGAKALTQSHLDPELGAALERATAATGTRVALVRRPGRHADRQGPRRALIAHTHPGNTWIRQAELSDPASLLDLDFAAFGAGDHQSFGSPYGTGPLVLVCTNGKRDRCCAVLGRPLAAELAAAESDVWEVTHLGGHRFAPTLMVLPHGYAYGRADAVAVKSVTTALGQGKVITERCRGRSTWERPGQAAELAVRALTGEDCAEALVVSQSDTRENVSVVTVTHVDGRAWRVSVVSSQTPPAPTSCGAALTQQPQTEVTAVTPLGAGTAL